MAGRRGRRADECRALAAPRRRPPAGALDAGSLSPGGGGAAARERVIVDEDAVTRARAVRRHVGAAAARLAADHRRLDRPGLPLATGAAVACPERKVVCLEADGGGMYTLQALWTQARENLDVTTVVFANRSYEILQRRAGGRARRRAGPRSRDMLELDRPALDWVGLAARHGRGGGPRQEPSGLTRWARHLGPKGPYLIDLVLSAAPSPPLLAKATSAVGRA